MGSPVRISLRASMFVCFVCGVLCCVGSGFCDERRSSVQRSPTGCVCVCVCVCFDFVRSGMFKNVVNLARV